VFDVVLYEAFLVLCWVIAQPICNILSYSAGGITWKLSPNDQGGSGKGTTVGGTSTLGTVRRGSKTGSTRDDESESAYQESESGMSDYRSESGSRRMISGSQYQSSAEVVISSPRARKNSGMTLGRNGAMGPGGKGGGGLGFGGGGWSLDLAEVNAI
jgi:hypothetical protein